jgi:hypothetical protein
LLIDHFDSPLASPAEKCRTSALDRPLDGASAASIQARLIFSIVNPKADVWNSLWSTPLCSKKGLLPDSYRFLQDTPDGGYQSIEPHAGSSVRSDQRSRGPARRQPSAM